MEIKMIDIQQAENVREIATRAIVQMARYWGITINLDEDSMEDEYNFLNSLTDDELVQLFNNKFNNYGFM